MHQNPIEMSAERKNQGGAATLVLVGKCEAAVMATDPDAASRIETRRWPFPWRHP
jgi:hypothetical protein